jgi:hypothetical protein
MGNAKVVTLVVISVAWSVTLLAGKMDCLWVDVKAVQLVVKLD